ncbi:MAG: type II 3-dehydroquinate dehydratase, partial [Actinomycetota bacterium]|nr:type II 3-dehydroquinate dehydratase [Actinomycetota bacterium]
MPLIAVVNGPNLNLLGERDPEIYGTIGWEEVRDALRERAAEMGVELEFFQSNHEGAIIDYLQGLRGRAAGLVINPGALTHYGYSLRDALADLDIPAIEVHLSNIFAREEWRARSVVSPVVRGVISGLGTEGYLSAVRIMA